MNQRFFVGAATAAHQVEGNNVNSDCWTLEHLPHSSYKEPSLNAVDHYNRYEEDIKLMEKAGMNAYRFSIEWARIEPKKGEFSEEEIAHYGKVIRCCKEHGLTPIVTMMHFSSPKWLIEEGGWDNPSVVDYFANYCAYVVKHLGEDMEYVCTLNEANMRMQMAAIIRTFMKQMGVNLQVGMNFDMPEDIKVAQQEERDAFGGVQQVATFLSGCTPEADELIGKAHMEARRTMKELCPHLKVGMTLSLHDIQPVEGGEEQAKELWDEEFMHYLPYIKEDDFFGLQNYTRTLVGADGELPVPEGNPLTQMDYEFYPEALGHVIRKVAEKLSMPIIVTENGVATDKDEDRVAFIERALSGVKQCREDGIPVIGYMYWSLMDNFEWQLGYSKTFGLIAVDRSTQERKPKDSFYQVAEIAKRMNLV